MNNIWDNISYTTTTNIPAKINIGDIAKAMQEAKKILDERPKIMVMDIKSVVSDYLTGNIIILSKDVGEALEKALEESWNKQ